MQKLQISSILFFLLLFSFSSNAKNWYVDDAFNTSDIYTLGSVAGSDAATGTALAPLASLAKAIISASAGDFIYVDAGTFSGANNSGINKNMVINKALNIYGAGENLTIFDGANTNAYFLKITASNVVVENMKVISYAYASTDEANSISIYAGTANLTGISFENVWFDKCVGSGGDGSVRIGNSGTYSVAAKFESCLATCNAAGLYGGAFYIKGNNHKIELSNCYFESNQRAVPGGAIYIQGTNSNIGTSTIVSIQNSTFKNNTSRSNGGVIYVEGSTLNVLSSCFNNNQSTSSYGSNYGNAICGGKSSKINITNSSFDNNFGDKGYQLAVSSSLSNMVSGAPTGTIDLTIDNCYFNGNVTPTSATAIYNKGATCSVTNSTFTPTTKVENVSGTFKLQNSGNPTKTGTFDPSSNTTASLKTANPPCIGNVTGTCGSNLTLTCPTVFHPIINAASITFAADQSCYYIVPTYTATDYCIPSANITITQNPIAGSVLAPGTTTAVTITASDPTTLISKTITVNLTTPSCTTPIPPLPPTTTKAIQNFCSTNTPVNTVADILLTGTNIKWYDAASSGSIIPSTSVLMDNKKYYASQTVNNLESITRTEVTVYILNPPTLTITNPVAVCSPISVNITLNPAVISTNGTTLSYWSDNKATTTITNQVAITTSGTYYIKSENAACSIIKPVVVTINATPTLTITNPTAVCSPTTVDITTSTSVPPNGTTLSYWSGNSASTAITNPAAITTSGTYYIKSENAACSIIKPVVVTIGNPSSPITSNTNQTFCASSSPRVADLTVTGLAGSTITWYDATNAGNAYQSTALLVNGLYYVSQTTSGSPACESTSRTAVTVSIINPLAPTTTSATQSFCSIDAKKVSDLWATGVAPNSTITWYNAETLGTAYANTDTLKSLTYYATQTDGGCESDTRLKVTVSVNDPLAPTTSSTTQSFCSIDAKKVSDLWATGLTGSTLTWYNAATLGTAYLSSDLLVSGTYYASQKVGFCESKNRLAVSVNIIINPSSTIIPQGTTTFCQGGSVVLNTSNGIGYTYEWYKDGIIINSAISSSYTANKSGSYKVKVTNGACSSTSTTPITVTVNQAPIVSYTSLASYIDYQHSPIILIGTPSGGTFSGPGISGNVFNPSIAGLGKKTVTYNITNSNNNCSGSAFQSTIVNDTLGVVCTTYDTITVTDTLLITTTLSLNKPTTNTLKIYPNPAKDHITINNGNFAAMSNYTIRIDNALGQQVFFSVINQQSFYVDLSSWSGDGVYFVYLKDSQGTIKEIRKIVLQ
jgi:predicted outer membrane repeat protein